MKFVEEISEGVSEVVIRKLHAATAQCGVEVAARTQEEGDAQGRAQGIEDVKQQLRRQHPGEHFSRPAAAVGAIDQKNMTRSRRAGGKAHADATRKLWLEIAIVLGAQGDARGFLERDAVTVEVGEMGEEIPLRHQWEVFQLRFDVAVMRAFANNTAQEMPETPLRWQTRQPSGADEVPENEESLNHDECDGCPHARTRWWSNARE